MASGYRHAYQEDFRRVAECFTETELVKLLHVTRRTLRRWLAGKTHVPWAAYQLALEHSWYGLADRDAAEGFNRKMLEQLQSALAERVAMLERMLADQARLVDWGCANDPFVSPTDPRSRNKHA